MTQIDRRAFLRQSAYAIAAMPLLAQPRSASRQRIIVIGAGLAGLSAAHQLGEAGHEVTILEARTRPGGRVFTMREPFADGLYAEAGAMHVFEAHRRAMSYIKLLGLDLDPLVPSKLAHVIHVMGRRVEIVAGGSVTWPFEMKPDEQNVTVGGLMAKYVNPLVKEVTDADARGNFPASVERYDRLTFTELLRQQGASSAAVAIINAGLPSGLGDGGDAVSALNLMREMSHRMQFKQGYTIRGGSDRLPKALAARLADKIRYGAPVSRIEQDDASVRVVFQQGVTSRTLTADRVVCAVPFTVLRRLHITPALSSSKQNAVDHLQYTSVVRTFVQTKTRFWTSRGLSGNASTDLPVMGVYERTINQAGSRGILESYAAGREARRLTVATEAERLAAALTGMTKVFPGIEDQYEAGASKAWDADEWSRGAYAWFRPGQMTTLLPHIATPEGRIHFAGEHTSSQPGWMEGALESGDRVTEEIERRTKN